MFPKLNTNTCLQNYLGFFVQKTFWYWYILRLTAQRSGVVQINSWTVSSLVASMSWLTLRSLYPSISQVIRCLRKMCLSQLKINPLTYLKVQQNCDVGIIMYDFQAFKRVNVQRSKNNHFETPSIFQGSRLLLTVEACYPGKYIRWCGSRILCSEMRLWCSALWKMKDFYTLPNR